VAIEIKYHVTAGGRNVAEVLPGAGTFSDPDEILNLMAEARMNDCGSMIIHEQSFHPDFFDLKTKVAGEILQKFSNYRMRLAIIGDFTKFRSKSLNDFIRESNRTGIINFAGTRDEALSRLRH
jgi:hypothetical protein